MRQVARFAALSAMMASAGCSSTVEPPRCERILGGDWTTDRCDGRVVLEADHTFLFVFESASAELTERSQLIATRLAEEFIRLRRAAAGEIPNTRSMMRDPRLIFVGHAWTTGSPRSDERLSIARAQAIANALVERGVPREAISVAAFGRRQPLIGVGVRPENQTVQVGWRDGGIPVPNAGR